jgi:phosphoribosyl 1,2-cyclic phosphodiesterase
MAMRMTVLASGSRGNCTVVSTSRGSILVDAGISCRETLKRMKAVGDDPHQLRAIVISHEHADHVAGLQVVARRLKVPVFITEGTYDAWRKSTKICFSINLRPSQFSVFHYCAGGFHKLLTGA